MHRKSPSLGPLGDLRVNGGVRSTDDTRAPFRHHRRRFERSSGKRNMGWESRSRRCNRMIPAASARAIALKLASCGAAVCINYVAQRDMAEQVVADIQTAGGRSIAKSRCRRHWRSGSGRHLNCPGGGANWPRLTILVNNAGVVMSGTLDDYDHAAYQRIRQHQC